MRAVIYARHLSDLQAAASIEDQVIRPGIQALLADAAKRRFDLGYMEPLDPSDEISRTRSTRDRTVLIDLDQMMTISLNPRLVMVARGRNRLDLQLITPIAHHV